MKFSILMLVFTFNFAQGADHQSLIQTCVEKYNSSNESAWYDCWDSKSLAPLYEKMAKKNGMTVDQMKKMAFQSERNGSGKVSLVTLLESCQDQTIRAIEKIKGNAASKKAIEEMKAKGSVTNYYYEATSEKQGKLGLRFDIIEKNGSSKIMSYHYDLCSENPNCVEKNHCSKVK